MKNQYEIRGDIVAIFLKRRNGEVLETIIDIEDLEKAKGFKGMWYAHWDKYTKSYRAFGNKYIQKNQWGKIVLSRWLFDEPVGKEIDHKDHNTLNNRRISNLRITTRAQNMQNLKGAHCDSKSGIRGIGWNNKSRKWRVCGQLNGKKQHIGCFANLEDAIAARKNWELKNMPFAS